jgi:hypothetical protein
LWPRRSRRLTKDQRIRFTSIRSVVRIEFLVVFLAPHVIGNLQQCMGYPQDRAHGSPPRAMNYERQSETASVADAAA